MTGKHAMSATATKKEALYLGNNLELFGQVQRSSALVYDLRLEEVVSGRTPTKTAELILIEALTGQADQALALIPGLKEQAGGVPLFMLIDHRDADFLLAASRLGAQGFIEVPDDLPHLLALIHKENRRLQGEYRGEVTTFFSLKGGVGCTTLAVNIAQHLAMRTGGHTVLVDLNMPLGDSSLYLNTDTQKSYSLHDFILNLKRFDDKLIYDSLTSHASGIYYLGLPPKLEELEAITDANIKAVLAMLRRYFDHVVLDCASDLSPVTIACLDESDHILLIAEPSLSSMRAVRIAHDTCRQLGYPEERLRLILNRQTSVNTQMSNALVEALGLPVAAEVENNYFTFLEALQEGKLLHDHCPGCTANLQLEAVSRMLLQNAPAVASASTETASSSQLPWFRKLLTRILAAIPPLPMLGGVRG